MRWLLLVAAVFACGCTVNAVAPAATPNVIAAGKSDEAFSLKVTNFPVGEVCSEEGGLKDLCVTHLGESISDGLNQVLSEYLKPGPGGYSAEFKYVEFKHSAASGSVVGQRVVGLPSQFVMRNAAGEPVVQLAATTVGPNRIMDAGAADAAIGALVNTTLETIAKGLNESKFWTHGQAARETVQE
jgi:hypothetical protein